MNLTREETADRLMQESWAINWATSLCKIVLGKEWNILSQQEKNKYLYRVIYTKLAPSHNIKTGVERKIKEKTI